MLLPVNLTLRGDQIDGGSTRVISFREFYERVLIFHLYFDGRRVGGSKRGGFLFSRRRGGTRNRFFAEDTTPRREKRGIRERSSLRDDAIPRAATCVVRGALTLYTGCRGASSFRKPSRKNPAAARELTPKVLRLTRAQSGANIYGTSDAPSQGDIARILSRQPMPCETAQPASGERERRSRAPLSFARKTNFPVNLKSAFPRRHPSRRSRRRLP